MPTLTRDRLQDQIDEKRKEIHSDQYSMSIGELANMYRDGELDIHPEFQRFFRWSPEQKSRFVESILLGIPIPSLFVAQRDDAKWDVIDGLQRLATLFQLMGILKDQEGRPVEALTLTKTRYLPAMEGKCWGNGNGVPSLTSAQQLLIRRAKLDIKIVLRESDESAKFELFQRLNTGGAPLSDQEIRNAMLVAANKAFYDWLTELANYHAFCDCVMLSDGSRDERYDMELALRFVLFRALDQASLSGIGDIGEFLTDEMMELSKRFASVQRRETAAFHRTFDILARTLGDNAFRRFDPSRGRFTGPFLISAFEAVAIGIGYYLTGKTQPQVSDPENRVKRLWSSEAFLNSMGAGIRASQRIPKTIRVGREVFSP